MLPRRAAEGRSSAQDHTQPSHRRVDVSARQWTVKRVGNRIRKSGRCTVDSGQGQVRENCMQQPSPRLEGLIGFLQDLGRGGTATECMSKDPTFTTSPFRMSRKRSHANRMCAYFSAGRRGGRGAGQKERHFARSWVVMSGVLERRGLKSASTGPVNTTPCAGM